MKHLILQNKYYGFTEHNFQTHLEMTQVSTKMGNCGTLFFIYIQKDVKKEL